ncbi:pentatricopeptide repeat-containing protein At3g29230-like [Typha angustifolia]|uniref:pentatricopeptide repeat-containing protein At3g29230-like n=1 Tax=Typha angustifolia TaxID=59011 RepID=UPI003C2DCCCF
MLSSNVAKIHQLSKVCNSTSHLKQLLAQIILSNSSNHSSSLAALLSFSANSSHVDPYFAALLFAHSPLPNVLSYNYSIQSLVDARLPDQALLLYLRMNRNSVTPDNFTFTFLLKSCSLLSFVTTGKAFHAMITHLGFSSDPYVQSGLIRLYSEVDEIVDARRSFDETPERDVVLWNTMLGAYVKCGSLELARELFEEMTHKNVGSYNALIGGYVKFGDLISAAKLFEKMPERDIVSWNTMIGAHAKSGNVEKAREYFDRMPQKNIATWSAIISGFTQSSRFREALELFKGMLAEGMRPDQSILVSVLSSCAHLGALEQAMWIHSYITRQGYKVDDLLGSSLIDMYSKCGMLLGAQLVFEGLEKRAVCSWNSMIYALAIHGHPQEAIEAFEEMQRSRILPDDLTFVAILRCCSHAGLVENGREIFSSMRQVYGITPKIEHYTCMVDLLSRANLLDEARELIGSMPMEPDIFVLGALFSGLRIHEQRQTAYGEEDLCTEVMKLRPRDSGAFVLVSNLYSSVNRWDEARSTRKVMEEFGVRKNPGCSLIDVNGMVHEFLASGRKHARSKQVYQMLDNVYRAMRTDCLT